jgi:hypothetical protein
MARVRWYALERRLLEGEDSGGDPLLARRAAQLSSRRVRENTAHGVAHLIAEAAAARPEPRLTAAIPTLDDEILRAEAILRTIVDRLRDRRPIGPLGIARIRAALAEGDSPLYVRGAPGGVATWAQHVLEDLDDGLA